jgi:hypothetical protein
VTRSQEGSLEDNKIYISRKDTELTIATTDDYTEVFEDGTGILYLSLASNGFVKRNHSIKKSTLSDLP